MGDYELEPESNAQDEHTDSAMEEQTAWAAEFVEHLPLVQPPRLWKQIHQQRSGFQIFRIRRSMSYSSNNMKRGTSQT